MSDLELVDDLKVRLKDYILSTGREAKQQPGGVLIRCLCHSPDRNPSMYIGDKLPHIAHCWSCKQSISIYQAHNILEGAPLYGRDFIEKNLNVLAVKFGYEPVVMSELTEDQIYKLNLYQIHEAISVLLSQATEGRVHRKFSRELGISDDIASEMGIGTIVDFDKLIGYLQRIGNWTLEELEQAGIRSALFGPTKLTHTIHDRRGRAIAFSSRDYRIDGKFGCEQATEEPDRNGKMRPIPKWSNSFTSPIYEKANTLYGYHRLKKTEGNPSAYIVEGYIDAAVMWSYGIDNTVCVGSTALAPQHLVMVKEAGKEIAILTMDNDGAGLDAVERVLEASVAIPTLRIEVLCVPQDPKNPSKVIDPDDFLKAYGVEAFHNLYKMSAFEFKLNRLPTSFESDAERDVFVRNFLPVILKETSAITQASMRNVLSRKTGVSEQIIREYQENLARAHSIETREHLRKDLKLFTRKLDETISFQPQDTLSVITDFRDRANDRLNSASISKLSVTETVEALAQWRSDRLNADVQNMFWKTGWKYFDNVLGGVQKSDVLWAFSAGQYGRLAG